MVTQISLDIEIVVEHRLQTFFGDVLVHGFKASAVVDFKLLVAACAVLLLSGVFAFVVANSGGYSGRNLCSGNFDDAVAESGAFAGRYRDADKGQENPVGAEYLAKLRYVDV